MGNSIKLAYSTYALQGIDPLEALQRIRTIGYNAVEIAVGDDWPTAPRKLGAAARQELRTCVEDLGFPPPALFGPVPTCAEGPARAGMLEQYVRILDLADDLNFGSESAVVTTTVGGRQLDWENDRMRIADDLVELAELAAEARVILAAEPHVGGAFDTPEKAAWLMRQTEHRHLKLNYDHSHFHVQGMDLQHCVDLCLPYASHVHIKDGFMTEGKVTFLLPGDGSLDLAEYMAAVAKGGIGVPVTAEVSAMIWREPGYDPWPIAELCYGSLDGARRVVAS